MSMRPWSHRNLSIHGSLLAPPTPTVAIIFIIKQGLSKSSSLSTLSFVHIVIYGGTSKPGNEARVIGSKSWNQKQDLARLSTAHRDYSPLRIRYFPKLVVPNYRTDDTFFIQVRILGFRSIHIKGPSRTHIYVEVFSMPSDKENRKHHPSYPILMLEARNN